MNRSDIIKNSCSSNGGGQSSISYKFNKILNIHGEKINAATPVAFDKSIVPKVSKVDINNLDETKANVAGFRSKTKGEGSVKDAIRKIEQGPLNLQKTKPNPPIQLY